MATNKRPRILLNMVVENLRSREWEAIISTYPQRVAAAGGLPILMPSIQDADLISQYLDNADGVIFIGGPDYHPAYYGEEPHIETNLKRMRPEFDIFFGKMVMARSMPVLGICAGCQLLNIITGGKLIQHLDNAGEHRGGMKHWAKITADGFFARAVGKNCGETLTVNSFHHQALNKNFIGKDLQITAEAFDGTVEAVEIPGERMVLGVQFHPERMDDLAPGIFGLLIEQARKFAER